MRRRTGRNEANLRQPDSIGEFLGESQVGEMDGVEGSAEHADGGCETQWLRTVPLKGYRSSTIISER